VIQRWLIISADCQDLRFRVNEFLDTSLVPGDFLGSTTGERGREKGDDDSVLAAEVGQFESLAKTTVQVEVGSGVADLQVSLARLHHLRRKTRGG
jgi:hypothetical protein